MLKQVLEQTIKERGVTVRKAAREMGISHATIYRIYKDLPVDFPTLEKVAAWLEIPVANVLDVVSPPNGDDLQAVLAEVVAVKPELAEVFAQIAQEIRAGTMDMRDLDEVVSFAAYKLNLSTRGSNERRKKTEVHPGSR
ncbi:MAG TPA: helix-turn-helix transcriptional regulator [Anaerolineaceae bacterium]|nr:helix-turn-helix transcriptional regulator [Anaerolineaceae bacterium]